MCIVLYARLITLIYTIGSIAFVSIISTRLFFWGFLPILQSLLFDTSEDESVDKELLINYRFLAMLQATNHSYNIVISISGQCKKNEPSIPTSSPVWTLILSNRIISSSSNKYNFKSLKQIPNP